MEKLKKILKSETCQNSTFIIGLCFFITMFILHNPWMIIPTYFLFSISAYGVLNDRSEKLKKEIESKTDKPKKEPTEWMGYKDGKKHVLTLFFDDKLEKYRVADMYGLKILPYQFESKTDGLNYIYSNYESVQGLIIYNCL